MESGISTARLSAGEGGERFTPLRRQLGVTSFGLNQIVLEPGQRGRIHRHHEQEEVYLVLEGTLDLIVEGETHELQAGELARVAPDLRRQLVNRGPGRVSLLALGSSGEHAGRDGRAFADWTADAGGSPQDVPAPDDLSAGELRGG